MLKVVQQTHSEKIAMYMKLTKRELAEMLIAANNTMTIIMPCQYYSHEIVYIPVQPQTSPNYCPPYYPITTNCGINGNTH